MSPAVAFDMGQSWSDGVRIRRPSNALSISCLGLPRPNSPRSKVGIEDALREYLAKLRRNASKTLGQDMDPLVVTISHALDKDEVVRRLQPALGRAAQMFPVLNIEHEQWSDNRMDFQIRAFGQAVTGNVLVGDKEVRLEITLPWLLAKFADVVRDSIERRVKVLVEKK